MLDVLNLVDNQNENVNEANENNAVNTMLSSGGLAPIFDNKTNEFDVQSEENLNFVDRGNSDVMMTPINSENQDLNNQFQSPINVSNPENMMTPIVSSNEEENLGGFKYLEDTHNFEIPKFDKNIIDDEEPFSSFNMAGKWIKEAVDLQNYRKAIESMGEEVAKYKWAFDEGKMGEFDLEEFSKETIKSGVRSFGVNTLNMVGNIASMLGTNLKNDENDINSDSVVRKNVLPVMSKTLLKMGDVFRDYAKKVEDIEFLTPSEDVYDEDPNFARLANILGGGASQVLTMGVLSKSIGRMATYGLYSAGSGSEVFRESYEKDKDLTKANALAVANAGTSFVIDKIFNPLPEVVEKNAKVTAKMIADELVGAPLREGGTEVLQQMLSENLVRKIGIDDTQDLFEGLIESALGSFMGSAVLVGANGVSYASGKAVDEVHKRMALRGISEEDFILAKNNMLDFMAKKPEAFEKILSYNLEENLKKIESEAKLIKNSEERKHTLRDIKKFDDVYEKMKNRFNEAIGDEKKASMAARLFEANAISLYEMDKSLTPEKYIGGLLPAIKSLNFSEFKNLNKPDDNVLYHFVGVNAKNIDLESLTEAYKLEKKGLSAQEIWQKTGWFRGADGMMRREVSDKDAKVIAFDDVVDDYEHEGISQSDFSVGEVNAIDNIIISDALKLGGSEKLRIESVYWDFLNYLKKQDKYIFWKDNPLYDETFDRTINEPDNSDKILQNRLGEKNKIDKAISRDALYKKSDYNEEEKKIISAELERRKFKFFIKEFGSPDNSINSEKMKQLEEKMSFKYKDNEKFFETLEKIKKDYLKKKISRMNKLEKNNIGTVVDGELKNALFNDLDREYEFRRFKVFNGDFSDEKIDMKYKPDNYKKAFEPYRDSERFLNLDRYKFMSDLQKSKIIPFLDKFQEMFELQQHKEYILKTDRIRNIKENAVRNYNAYDETSSNRRVRKAVELKKIQNGMQMRLGDVLEHELLYNSYPDLKDIKVMFTPIDDDLPHHFYFNRDEGYVLEIDANQLDYSRLKDILLLGASFAIQEKENFDFSLSFDEQKNFMDRHYYIAKRDTQKPAIDALQEFISEVMPERKYRDFLIAKEMPVALLGLTHSRAKGTHNKKTEVVKYYDIDFDKIEQELDSKYRNFSSGEDRFVKDYMYYLLHNLKRSYARMITVYAQNHSGYRFAGMPWAGIISQGNIDAKTMLKRGGWNDNKTNLLQFEYLSSKDKDETDRVNSFFNVLIYRENRDEKNSVDEKEGQKEESYGIDSFDVTRVYDEFEEYSEYDKKHFSETIESLVKGAYDEANKTIFLFENADVETILHESFHYFSDVIEKANLRTNSQFDSFFETRDTLREEFINSYNIRQSDSGLYYAYLEVNDEIVNYLPVGYESLEKLIEAGINEMYVDRIVRVATNKVLYPDNDPVFDGIVLFNKWLVNVVKTLGIDSRKCNEGGKKVIKFIKKNFKK